MAKHFPFGEIIAVKTGASADRRSSLARETAGRKKSREEPACRRGAGGRREGKKKGPRERMKRRNRRGKKERRRGEGAKGADSKNHACYVFTMEAHCR